MHANRSSRSAFTLLEVILALALSALLLGALTMAIQTSLKATYSGRADVAEAQLARAALERIAGDLRAAVWVEQPDPASLVVPPAVASLTSSSSSGGSGGSPGSSQSGSSSSNTSSSNSSSGGGGSSSSGGSSRSGGGSTASGGGSMTSSGSSGSSGSNSSSSRSSGGGGGGQGGGGGGGAGGGASGSSPSSSSSTAATQMPMPTFIGGQNWLQVDVSHLPRPDQYALMQNMAINAGGGGAAASNASAGGSSAGNSSASGATTARDRISEMKTVYYFLAGQGGGASQMPPGLTAGMTGNQQGLMRREADRAVTAWTTYGGGSAGMGPALEALAPEIESLNFQYFNGSTWTTTWDSRVNYCLPRAVEIRITLVEPSAPNGAAKQPARRPRDKSSAKEYVLRVPIRAWRPANLQLLNSLANQAAASSGASGSSTSTGAGGAGSY